jgi:hypothetical protein
MSRAAGTAIRAAIVTLLWTAAALQPATADPFANAPTDGAAAAATEPAPLSAEELAEALPRDWRGTFLWEDGVAYYVEVEIVSVAVDATGDIGFTAETTWQPGALEARMSGRINPTSLGVAIWEIPDGTSADGFQSDGLYAGVLARDLWDLRATWVTSLTGATGTLVLVAKAVAQSSD